MLKVQRGRPRKNLQPNPQPNPTASHDVSIGSLDNESAPAPAQAEPKERKPRGRAAGQKQTLDRIRLMLEMTFGGATMIAGRANAVDGMIIKAGSPALIDSIMQLCEQDKRVRDFLFDLSSSSVYLNVAMASAAIIVPILANHGLIPPLFMPSPQPIPNATNGTVPGVANVGIN